MSLLGSVLGSVVGSRMGGPLGGVVGGALGGGGLRGGLGGGMLGGGLGRGVGMGMGAGALGSPVSKALMLLLAGKLAHDYMSRRQDAGVQPGGTGGGLGGGLPGVIGGGGLGGLLEQFRRKGQGEVADSWVQPGPNRRLSAAQLEDVLGPEAVARLQQETGLPREQLLDALADTLPDAVDQLTPDGRTPRDEDLLRD